MLSAFAVVSVMNGLVAQAETDEQHRLVVTSIGAASPAMAAAVARGLGTPVPQVVTALYRSPAVLVDRAAPATARQMALLLSDLGFRAHAEPESRPQPAPPHLRDVALHLAEPRAAPAAARALAAFTAMTEAAALEMILTPPGLVLGAVSDATADALAARLPDGVELTRSRPEDASYHVFLLEGAAVLRQRLMADLAPLGVPSDAAPGLVAADVPHAAARDLWRRHGAGGVLRVVNTDFLRYDLVLEAAPPGAAQDPAVRQALFSEAGMPGEVVPDVLAALPVTLSEGVAHRDLGQRMAALAGAGLSVRAELATFQLPGLRIEGADDRDALATTLRALGSLAADAPLPRLPFDLDGPLTEPRARFVAAQLADAGARVRVLRGSS